MNKSFKKLITTPEKAVVCICCFKKTMRFDKDGNLIVFNTPNGYIHNECYEKIRETWWKIWK